VTSPSDALGGRDDRVQIEVFGAARGVVELERLQQEVAAELDQRPHVADRVGDRVGRGGLDVLETPGIDRAELPAMRAGEVDQLATGQVQAQHAARLFVDLLPCLRGDRGKLTLEQVHHAPPFRLPIPSEVELVAG
jgi:hypothetical protein